MPADCRRSPCAAQLTPASRLLTAVFRSALLRSVKEGAWLAAASRLLNADFVRPLLTCSVQEGAQLQLQQGKEGLASLQQLLHAGLGLQP